MLRRSALLALPVCAALGLAAFPASAGQTHTYAVTVTIKVEDRATHKVGGKILSDAPSTFCTESSVRVRKVAPGKDPAIGLVFKPPNAEWHIKLPRHRGEKIYAEVSTYHLPQRPVICLGDRSGTIRAP
jgi:hypothetical protein